MVMRYGVLGPLEVRDGEWRIEVRSAKQRALLAMLLLNANRVVSTSRLVDALWNDAPPETSAKGLQVHVSQLRKLLGHERIETRAPGYVLRVGEGELDAERFIRLMEEGRFQDALGLWRGPALAEFAGDRFARPYAARLEALRLTCIEERIDEDLAAGRGPDLIADLETFVAEEPLRERPRQQLILALYRSGRQADALAQYQAARAILVGELGIEPSRPLRELHQAVLRQDPALDLTDHLAEVDRSRGVFVGREADLAVLVECLDETMAGRGRVVLISGEPGIGKSRLADELVAMAGARRAAILVGRCWEAGGAPAFWPWVQALRVLVSDSEPDDLRGCRSGPERELCQILPGAARPVSRARRDGSRRLGRCTVPALRRHSRPASPGIRSSPDGRRARRPACRRHAVAPAAAVPRA